jgi:hypothetical protein
MNESNFDFEKNLSPAFLQARDALMAGESIPSNLNTLLTEKEREELIALARLGRFTSAAIQTQTPSEGAEETAWRKAQKALHHKKSPAS